MAFDLDMAGRIAGNRKTRQNIALTRPVWCESDASWQINLTSDDNRYWSGTAFHASASQAKTSAKFAFSRASSAYSLWVDGAYRSFTADAIRLTPEGADFEKTSRNVLFNSQLSGGVAGTPGTVPTNTSASSTANGLTRTIAFGTWDNGLPYVEYTFAGTASATSTIQINLSSNGSTDALNVGDTYTNSLMIEVVSAAGITALVNRNVASLSGASAATVNSASILTATTPQRVSLTAAVPASKNSMVIGLLANFTTGNIVNLKLRVAKPQMELGSVPSSFIDTPVSAGATRPVDTPSWAVPSGVYDVTVTYNDNNTTLFQAVDVSNNLYLIPVASLTGTRVRRIKGVARRFVVKPGSSGANRIFEVRPGGLSEQRTFGPAAESHSITSRDGLKSCTILRTGTFMEPSANTTGTLRLREWPGDVSTNGVKELKYTFSLGQSLSLGTAPNKDGLTPTYAYLTANDCVDLLMYYRVNPLADGALARLNTISDFTSWSSGLVPAVARTSTPPQYNQDPPVLGLAYQQAMHDSAGHKRVVWACGFGGKRRAVLFKSPTAIDVTYATRSALYADLNWPKWSFAVVDTDSTVDSDGIYYRRGVYIKNGNPGEGSWGKVAEAFSSTGLSALTSATISDGSAGHVLPGNAAALVLGDGTAANNGWHYRSQNAYNSGLTLWARVYAYENELDMGAAAIAAGQSQFPSAIDKIDTFYVNQGEEDVTQKTGATTMSTIMERGIYYLKQDFTALGFDCNDMVVVTQQTSTTLGAARDGYSGGSVLNVGTTTIPIAATGSGPIAVGDYIRFWNYSRSYKVVSGIADVGLGGSIQIEAPGLLDQIPAMRPISISGSSAGVTQAQLNDAKAGRYVCAGPQYDVTYIDDYHTSPFEYIKLGVRAAAAIEYWRKTGRCFFGIYIESATVTGNTMAIVFNTPENADIEVDPAITGTVNYGITLQGITNGATVTGASLSGRTVTLTFSTAPVFSDGLVEVAWRSGQDPLTGKPLPPGPTSGARSPLCVSLPEINENTFYPLKMRAAIEQFAIT